MDSLTAMEASNARVATELPPGLVGVFIGATSGIGENCLKAFAKHATKPRAYFVGRSQEAGDRILSELKELNPEGSYIFRKADVSLIKVVDEICINIKSKEKAINILCLSQGVLQMYAKTAEDLHLSVALTHYSRMRFIVNLLPLIQNATSLRRVISVFTAGKEGPLYTDDIQAWKIPMRALTGHAASLTTAAFEALGKKAPDVSFIHAFPGAVDTNFGRKGQGAIAYAIRQVFKAMMLFMEVIPHEECGERFAFIMTSAKYPAKLPVDGTSGLALAKGEEVAKGTDGKAGSGVYSIDQNGESYGAKTEEMMAKLRKEGAVEKVWADLETEWKRITGLEAV
ncbi:hypothetical protein L207DRAFT_461273 [Hyaloscypha variabilis F]|uniref:NAD(P)-binding protein n=1 Tax=Hyaloscypha variabilis (strain UAMH 11265 / GT02V1 / F) TaxID=1149755 RepID=A0A2J6RJQ8_HYAVF|nr:hypothetical protein L207DRAFT_461273 [Hyaloscypha variabilis F]